MLTTLHKTEILEKIIYTNIFTTFLVFASNDQSIAHILKYSQRIYSYFIYTVVLICPSKLT